MPTFTQQISDTSNDVRTIGTSFTATSVIQGFNSTPTAANAGFRFTGVTVPQGATIVSATLTVVAKQILGTLTAARLGKWFGDKVADAPAWSSTSRPNQITPTTASTQVIVATSANQVLVHDFTAIVQELVDQPSYALNNDMRFAGLGQTGGETSQQDYVELYDFNQSSANAATLSITYTTSATTTLTADKGSYALTGKSAAYCIGMATAKGGYSLTGKDAGLSFVTILSADKGNYLITGRVVSLAVTDSRKLQATKGSYSLTGHDVAFNLSMRLIADKGRYRLNGKSIVLTASGAASEGTSTTMLRVPVAFSNINDWVRKSATAVNQLIAKNETQAAQPFLISVSYPADPQEGQAVYRSDLHKAFIFDGTAWEALW